MLCLGIAIILFAILFKLCSSGLDTFALLLGLLGLGISISASLNKKE
ncbi:MAG: hypothetical protein K0S41_788 [Anaerocolumna sp.]|jgi:hypothetical protein|nr:hypothetical protein [Anaerocolumna sp.]